MLRICLTYDYELFFGKNLGTYKRVLFGPTENLLKVLKENGVSATFFADVCSVIRCEQLEMLDYVNQFTKQVQVLSQNNQDVQLHIHPHWLASNFAEGEWNFNGNKYRIHSFGFDRNTPDNAYNIIRDGVQRLENIIQPVNPNYMCLAYRAGGFVLQPHHELIRALYDNGIRIDSSIAPHLSSTSSTNGYDYQVQKMLDNWFITGDREWWYDSENQEGSIYEIPVATEKKKPIVFAYKRLLHPESIKLSHPKRMGTYINETDAQSQTKFNYWNYISGYSALSMDSYKADYLHRQLIRFYKKHKCVDNDVAIALIGHPKLVDDGYLENLDLLIHKISSDDRFEICNVVEAYTKNCGVK